MFFMNSYYIFCCFSIELKRVDSMAERLQIHHDGSVSRVPPTVYRSSCKVDMTNFPFDEQHCDFKFGTWGHSADKLDMVSDQYIN